MTEALLTKDAPEAASDMPENVPVHILAQVERYRGYYTFVVRFPAANTDSRIKAQIAAGRSAKGQVCWHCRDEEIDTFDVMIPTWRNSREEVDRHIGEARQGLSQLDLEVVEAFEIPLSQGAQQSLGKAKNTPSSS